MVLLVAAIMFGIAFFARLIIITNLTTLESEKMKIVLFRATLTPELSSAEGIRLVQILTAHHFQNPNTPEAQDAFQKYFSFFETFPPVKEIRLFDTKGKLLASNSEDKSDLLPSASQVLSEREFFTVSKDGDVLTTYATLKLDGNLNGVAEIKSDLSYLLAPASQSMNVLIGILIIVGILIVLIIYLIERHFILKPIRYLQKQAESIGGGILTNKVGLKAKDEFGTLADFFERMRVRLKSYRDVEEAKLESSIQSLQFGFVIIDARKTVLMWNKAATEILGSRKTKDGFKSLEEFFGTKYNVAKAYEQCLGSKEAVISSAIDTHKKFFKVSMFPIISGKVVGAVVIIDDITTETLLERNKQEFFAVASHELRTPLTSIRGNMSMIENYWGRLKQTEVLDMVKQTHESSKRLIKIVNDFLDASKLEHDQTLVKTDEVDIDKLITDVLKEIVTLARSKGLELIYKPCKDLPRVFGDKARLKQVVYNLVGNAINYTKEGKVTIETHKEGEFVKVVVSDTGIGITPQNQRLLFKKFQQAGKQVLSREVNVGTGMGLYISKLLINAMKGQIGLMSSSDKGSVFYFTIPTTKI